MKIHSNTSKIRMEGIAGMDSTVKRRRKERLEHLLSNKLKKSQSHLKHMRNKNHFSLHEGIIIKSLYIEKQRTFFENTDSKLELH